MPEIENVEARSARIEAAFRDDGFDIQQRLVRDGRLGMLACHARARNTGTGAPKRAYYAEGDGARMGWLIGAMAEPDVARMAGDFVENVAFAFFSTGPLSKDETLPRLKDLIVRIISAASERMLPDVPRQLLAEIDGIVEGCRAANPRTSVRRDRLLVLNLGIDCLLAHIYTALCRARRDPAPPPHADRLQRLLSLGRCGRGPAFFRTGLHVPDGRRLPGHRVPDDPRPRRSRREAWSGIREPGCAGPGRFHGRDE